MFLGMVEEMGCVITQPIFFARILRSIVPYTHNMHFPDRYNPW